MGCCSTNKKRQKDIETVNKPTVDKKYIVKEFQSDDVVQDSEKVITLFIGPPGCGKGTHAPRLASLTKQTHILIDQLIKQHIRLQTEQGKIADQAQKNGQAIDDNCIIKMIIQKVKEKECKGIILDGFPTTLQQAQTLYDSLKQIKCVYSNIVSFNIQEELILERVTGRRVHLQSGRIYHVNFNPPKVEGRDDLTGEELLQMQDDTEEAVRRKIANFNTNTKPIIDY